METLYISTMEKRHKCTSFIRSYVSWIMCNGLTLQSYKFLPVKCHHTPSDRHVHGNLR